MKVLCAFTEYNYGDPARGVSIEYASFLPAIRSLGHEVRHFETWDSTRSPTYAEMNRALLETADQWHPDLVFTVQRDYELWLETLDTLANGMGIALATWITDDSFKFKHYSRFIGSSYDSIGTTYEYRLRDYQAAGIEGAHYTQWAANEQWLQPPRPAHECTYPVSFIGTKYGHREELIGRLRESGLEVTCFGFGWASGPIETEQIPEIMRDSVISLNFSAGFRSDGAHGRQLKARTFEVPGAGGFLLSEQAPALDQFYSVGSEIDVFDGEQELEQKLRFYLGRPALRDSMANAAYERTRTQHLYSFRLRELFDVALERRLFRVAKRPIDTWHNNPVPTPGPLGFFERGLRAVLLKVCQKVWGEQRGVKAARRFAFEFSVRLLRSRTFTSRSLPGRLFPYV